MNQENKENKEIKYCWDCKHYSRHGSYCCVSRLVKKVNKYGFCEMFKNEK
jgi:hypothetical protein